MKTYTFTDNSWTYSVCDWLRQSSNINRFEKLDAIANLLYKEGLRIVK